LSHCSTSTGYERAHCASADYAWQDVLPQAVSAPRSPDAFPTITREGSARCGNRNAAVKRRNYLAVTLPGFPRLRSDYLAGAIERVDASLGDGGSIKFVGIAGRWSDVRVPNPNEHMTTRSTSKRSRRRYTFAKAAIAAGLVALSSSGVAQVPRSEAPTNDASDWQRQHIGMANGVPAAMRAMVQSSDGFIWIAGRDGVFRFDGVKFERIGIEQTRRMPSDTVNLLFAAPDGAVWAGHDWGGVSVIRAGRHVTVAEKRLNTIVGFAAAPDGAVWAASSSDKGQLLARIVGTKATRILQLPGDVGQFLWDLAFTSDGTLWLAIDAKLFAIAPGSNHMTLVRDDVSNVPRFSKGDGANALLLAAGKLWRLIPPTRSAGARAVEVAHGMSTSVSSLALDGHGGLWQADQTGKLVRLRRSGNTGATQRWVPDITLRTGLIDPIGFPPLLSDREGTVWVGTATGLDRYRRVSFYPFQSLSNERLAGGYGDGYGDPLAAPDGNGDMWIRRLGALYKVDKAGGLKRWDVRVPPKFTPCPASDRGVWVPDGKGNIALVGGRRSASRPMAGLKSFGKEAFEPCFEDMSGRLWVHDWSFMKILETSGPRVVEFGSETDKVGPTTISHDGRGGIFLYIGRKGLWRSDGRKSAEVLTRDRIPLGFVEAMTWTAPHLYMGGDRGLARFDGHEVRLLSRDRFRFLTFVSGIVHTPTGETWLQTGSGVIRMKTADVDRAFADPNAPLHPIVYDMGDGLPGTAAFAPPTITGDSAGRIYVMTNAGLVRHDPVRAPSVYGPPSVAITHVLADSRDLGSGTEVRLPLGAVRVAIEFAGLSFADPAKLRFRYRLDGVDSDWVDAGNARTAVYTALRPGTHTFLVEAAYNGGPWSREAQRVALTVPARFHQTWTFVILCGVAAAAVLALLHRLRLRQLSGRIRARIQIQLSERERIAQELHDTLLQSVQGLLIRFHGLSLRPELDGKTRQTLNDAMNDAENALIESREHVAGLRRERIIGLHRRIEEFAGKLDRPETLTITVNVAGEDRLLQPVAADAQRGPTRRCRRDRRHAGLWD
jgi:ligand-binding sensor domain-containing protein